MGIERKCNLYCYGARYLNVRTPGDTPVHLRRLKFISL